MKLRLRFSLRALLILVTLVAVYLGCWPATKRWGVPTEVDSEFFMGADSPAPLVVGIDELDPTMTGRIIGNAIRRRYYLWFFGLKINLPFTSDVEDEYAGGVL